MNCSTLSSILYERDCRLLLVLFFLTFKKTIKMTNTVEYDVWLEENQEELDIIASETGEDKKPCYDREEFQENFYQNREDILHYDISGLKDDEVKEVYQIIDKLKGEAFHCEYYINRLYGFIYVNLFSDLVKQVADKGITCKIRKEY